MRSARGFTLLEIIVVLAVLGALLAVLGPRVSTYIEDANLTRAQADVNVLAAAIDKMYMDTGRWPFYADGTGKLSFNGAADYGILTSHSACDGSADAATCDANVPEDGTVGTLWELAADNTDYMGHHLIMNTPAYSTDGSKAWRGPYVDRVPDVDPWGRSYLVNIKNADPADEGVTQPWVIVISAGPDGTLDTSPDALGTSNPAAQGDDIISRAK